MRRCSELINRFGSHAACKRPEYVAYGPFADQAVFRLGNPFFDFDHLYVDKAGLLCAEQNSLASCLIQAGDEPAFYDQHHLSLSFARLLGQRVAEGYGEDLVGIGFPGLTGGE